MPTIENAKKAGHEWESESESTARIFTFPRRVTMDSFMLFFFFFVFRDRRHDAFRLDRAQKSVPAFNCSTHCCSPFQPILCDLGLVHLPWHNGFFVQKAS